MKYSFQTFMDIKTSASSLSFYNIRAGGKYVLKRCRHLFAAYKYFKLGRISVKLVPASTLPVDPLGLSYDTKDPQSVDPRDQLNPGLVRITNGEDLFYNFTDLEDFQQTGIYHATLLDPRWSKFMLQSGFYRSAYPKFWDVAMDSQNQFPESQVTAEDTFLNESYTPPLPLVTGEVGYKFATDPQSNPVQSVGGDFDGHLIQVGHRSLMGYLPTDSWQVHGIYENSSHITQKSVPLMARIPSVNVISVLLPKAYKTVFYYRMFITETVYFTGLKNYGVTESTFGELRAIDNFTHMDIPSPMVPSEHMNPNVPPNKYPYRE